MALKQKGYRPRIVDEKLDRMLKIFGAVCIEGPKWCGKTWTALNHANSAVYLDDPSNNFQYRKLAEMSPELVLDGKYPHLVDEWQQVPQIWDAVRHKVDFIADKGCFILTGSATPNIETIMHSGAGRIGRIRMHTMSLFESGDSTGQISLHNLINGNMENCMTGDISLKHLIDLTVRGGWPECMSMDTDSAIELSINYLNAVVEMDIRSIDNTKRSGRKMRMLLRSLARNESTFASDSTILRDMADDGEEISRPTLSEYLNVLRRLYIIEDIPAFNPNLRSSIRVGKSPKRHFTDPSLASAALGATPEMMFNDINTFGFMFESMCLRDLSVYAESFRGRLYHYKDGKGREIDAVIELPDGHWGAFEIKLGVNQIDAAAENLLKIEKITSEDPKGKKPSVLCVICGMSSAAYKREDGVYVVPITALKN